MAAVLIELQKLRFSRKLCPNPGHAASYCPHKFGEIKPAPSERILIFR
ncbi:hypothetical protein EVA_09388 [gut metagenome]|uniref:Uncharacterized protein n=1 Tax=gut metagenome TaxID=749906 RepID=J9CQS2_9ZZZZ